MFDSCLNCIPVRFAPLRLQFYRHADDKDTSDKSAFCRLTLESIAIVSSACGILIPLKSLP